MASLNKELQDLQNLHIDENLIPVDLKDQLYDLEAELVMLFNHRNEILMKVPNLIQDLTDLRE